MILGKSYILQGMFPRISYFVPEEWAQLAGSMALFGSNLLQGKFTVLPVLMPGSPYIKYCLIDLDLFYWELNPQGSFL